MANRQIVNFAYFEVAVGGRSRCELVISHNERINLDAYIVKHPHGAFMLGQNHTRDCASGPKVLQTIIANVHLMFVAEKHRWLMLGELALAQGLESSISTHLVLVYGTMVGEQYFG
jgi:hypothetical protein